MPRKPKTQTRTVPPAGYDRESLAKLGAVVRAVALRNELREIEKAYPGTNSAAEYQIQKDTLAHARAVKQGQQATPVRGSGPVQRVTPGTDRRVVEEEAAPIQRESLANA